VDKKIVFMKKIVFSCILLFLGSIIILNFENSSRYSYRYILNNKVSSIITKNDTDVDFSDNSLERISIKFDTAVYCHIDSLIQLINDRKLNKYFKGTLKVNSEKYKVKIAIHGKEPDGHIFQKNISLKIKFKSTDNYFKCKKIKLIISQRLQNSFDNNQIIGNTFNILHTRPMV
jgi:hypothetical protein